MNAPPDPVKSVTESASEQSYAHKTVRNVAWLGGSQFVRQGVAMATTIVLARFLSPSDYGIFAMTLFINELAQLFVNFGIGSALVQRKEIDNRILSTCFWANLVIAGVISVVVVMAAPLASAYFRQPLVGQLLVVSAVNLGVGALLVIPQSLLARRLAFDRVALGSTVGSLGGAAGAVCLAFMGAGVWALVLQPLIGTALNLAYLARQARWLPRLEFDLPALRSVIGFSTHVLIDNLAAHVTRNLQQLIVAPIAGAAAMGLLAMATMAAWLPVAQFTSASTRAIYPVFARLQGEEDRLHAGIVRTMALIALLAFPVLVGLAVLAVDVMPLAFGPQWQDSAPLVSVLCVLCLIYSVAGVAGSALLAQGRSATTMRISLTALVFVALVLWSVRDRSILDVTIALSVSHGVVALTTLHLTLRVIPNGWVLFFSAIWRPMACSTGMALALWGGRELAMELGPMGRLALTIPLGALIYIALTLVLNRDGWSDLVGLIGRRRDSRVAS